MRGAAREAENMEKERREQSGHKASHEERAFSTGAARAPVQ